jgi:hypothetical protein
MSSKSEFLHCTFLQRLFSPKGGIEGALMLHKGRMIQVAMDAQAGAALDRISDTGKPVNLRAIPDLSPKAARAAHPVYRFDAFCDGHGRAMRTPHPDPKKARIEGVVAALHFTRHGRPNGVVLENGEFIHLRPKGMASSGLAVGATVTATGELRMTVRGTALLQARKVNRFHLD